MIKFKDGRFRYKFDRYKVLASFTASSGTAVRVIYRNAKPLNVFKRNKKVLLNESFLKMLNSVYCFSLCVLNAEKKQNFLTTEKS
jgi:hypothetical protein